MRYVSSVTSRAALFDMDRTLLSTTTAMLYTRYRRDRGEIGLGTVAKVGFWLLQYTFGVVDADKVARHVLEEFRGRADSSLQAETDDWFKSYVLEHVRKSGRAAVERHRSEGHHLAIITSATRYAAGPLARELGIEHVVATELALDGEGRLTGEPNGALCYGAGKIHRAEELAARVGFRLEEATFYSDSITDLPLLERVGTPIAVCPDARLRRAARKRGWAIEDWA